MVAVASVALGAGALVASLAGGASSSSETVPQRADHHGCPSGARSLPADGVAPAAEAALEAAPKLYRGIDLKAMKVTAATRASADRERGPIASNQCGARIRKRTAVVYLRFPAMEPSASLSEGVVFVARVGSGYKVWSVVH